MEEKENQSKRILKGMRLSQSNDFRHKDNKKQKITMIEKTFTVSRL